MAVPEVGGLSVESVDRTISPESFARTFTLAFLPWSMVAASAATVGAGKFAFGPAAVLAEICAGLSR